MFEILSNLTKAVVGVVITPVAVVADALTLGGLSTDRKEPYTVSTLKQVVNNLDKATK